MSRPDIANLRRAVEEIEARKPLTRAQAVAVLCRQAGGIECGCGCGEPLDPLGEGVTDEHVKALGFYGTNELDNRSFWRSPCSKRKTNTQDRPRMAKADRQAMTVGPRDPPKHPIPQRETPWPPKGSRKLQSRAFPKRGTR